MIIMPDVLHHNVRYLQEKKELFDAELARIVFKYGLGEKIPETSINCLGSYAEAIISKVKEMRV